MPCSQSTSAQPVLPLAVPVGQMLFLTVSLRSSQVGADLHSPLVPSMPYDVQSVLSTQPSVLGIVPDGQMVFFRESSRFFQVGAALHSPLVPSMPYDVQSVLSTQPSVLGIVPDGQTFFFTESARDFHESVTHSPLVPSMPNEQVGNTHPLVPISILVQMVLLSVRFSHVCVVFFFRHSPLVLMPCGQSRSTHPSAPGVVPSRQTFCFSSSLRFSHVCLFGGFMQAPELSIP